MTRGIYRFKCLRADSADFLHAKQVGYTILKQEVTRTYCTSPHTHLQKNHTIPQQIITCKYCTSPHIHLQKITKSSVKTNELMHSLTRFRSTHTFSECTHFSSRAVQSPPHLISNDTTTRPIIPSSVQDPPHRNRTNMLSAAACLPYQS